LLALRWPSLRRSRLLPLWRFGFSSLANLLPIADDGTPYASLTLFLGNAHGNKAVVAALVFAVLIVEENEINVLPFSDPLLVNFRAVDI
jgi:hypothetical protein